MSRIVKILNETGLHARPASQLVQVANKFASDVSIEFKGNETDAKSILGLMGLGLKKDDEINVIANGHDAAAAVDAIVNLIDQKFGEN